MAYWKITPSNSSEFDHVRLRAATEDDHQAALAWAKDRIEEIWDQMEVGSNPRYVELELVDGDYLPDWDPE